MLQKTNKELSEMKRQLISMGWNDKIDELNKSIESGKLVIVETKARSKHIDFCQDSTNVEQYRNSETEVAKLKPFIYNPVSYSKAETKSMSLLLDKVVTVERRVTEYTINAKSNTVYLDKDGKELEVPKESKEVSK